MPAFTVSPCFLSHGAHCEPEPDVTLPEANTFLAIKTMLTDQSRSWTAQWMAEGRAEGRGLGRRVGRKEGLMEGLQEGQQCVLKTQLLRKFGAVTPAAEQRLQNATPDELEAWTINVLDANSIDEVFVGNSD